MNSEKTPVEIIDLRLAAQERLSIFSRAMYAEWEKKIDDDERFGPAPIKWVSKKELMEMYPKVENNPNRIYESKG